MLKEAARTLCSGGLLLLGEWAKTPSLFHNGTQIPFASMFHYAYADSLFRVRGITDFVAHIPNIIRDMNAFDDIQVEEHFVPIGDWYPGLKDLGDRFRDGVKIGLDSIRPLLRQGGYADTGANTFIRGYSDEMDNVRGMGFVYYTIWAFRR
jgi:hypothetical protein